MKIRRKNFTLFELLISTALLIILTVVLLRMFVLTGDYWQYTEGQNDVYLDNKVLFNVMSDELNNIIYDYRNDSAGDKIHAPIFIGKFDHGASGTIKYPQPADSNSYDIVELKQGVTICFVTRTKRDSEAEHSDIAKVAYVFYPPLKDSSNGYSFLNDSRVPGEKNGVVVRMILDEDDDAKFTGDQNLADYYKFTLSQGKQVIDGVLDFQVTAYRYNAANKKLEAVSASDGKKGLTNIRAITVTMTMLPQDKMTEFKLVYQDKSATEQNDFLQKYARTFRRTFWISPMTAAD